MHSSIAHLVSEPAVNSKHILRRNAHRISLPVFGNAVDHCPGSLVTMLTGLTPLTTFVIGLNALSLDQAGMKGRHKQMCTQQKTAVSHVQEQDEMDELILADDEMLDLAPEDLPRRVLSDFAVYNAEGFCSSLELLPMWSGVDSDVDLYASGNVLDDDGEWAGGQTLSAGT